MFTEQCDFTRPLRAIYHTLSALRHKHSLYFKALRSIFVLHCYVLMYYCKGGRHSRYHKVIRLKFVLNMCECNMVYCTSSFGIKPAFLRFIVRLKVFWTCLSAVYVVLHLLCLISFVLFALAVQMSVLFCIILIMRGKLRSLV